MSTLGRIRSGGLAVVLAAVLALVGAPAAAAQGGDVEVTIEPAELRTDVGKAVPVAVTVTNLADRPTDDLVVHIDITDPRRAGSVDPEDWTVTLTRSAGVIPPTESVSLTWDLEPISGGRFTLYAVAMSPDSTTIVASEGVEVVVDERRALNPQGVLPVALVTPLAVGGLLLVRWNTRRRPVHRGPTTKTSAPVAT